MQVVNILKHALKNSYRIRVARLTIEFPDSNQFNCLWDNPNSIRVFRCIFQYVYNFHVNITYLLNADPSLRYNFFKKNLFIQNEKNLKIKKLGFSKVGNKEKIRILHFLNEKLEKYFYFIHNKI